MRKLTIKEFASATGQKDATVRQHVTRKKLVKDKDGFIPLDTVLTKNYIAEVTNGAGLYGAVVKTVKVKEEKSKPDKPEKTDEQKHIDDLDMRKRISQTQSIEREAELKGIQLQRLAGNLLPLDVVERILIINIQSIFKNFESSIENMAMITTEMLGGTRKDTSDIINRLRKELSIVIEKAKKDANYEITSEVKSAIENSTKSHRR